MKLNEVPDGAPLEEVLVPQRESGSDSQSGSKMGLPLKGLRNVEVVSTNIGVRSRVKVALTALGTVVALLGGKAIDNGGHQCGGCSVCVPPPVTRKVKDEDDENEGDKEKENLSR